MKWEIYKRGTIPLFRTSLIMEEINQKSILKLLPIHFSTVFYFNNGPVLFWSWNKKEIRNLGNKVVEICSSKNGAIKYFKMINSYAGRAILAAERIRRTDLKKLSNEELKNLLDYLFKEGSSAHVVMTTEFDSIDIVFEKFLQAKLRDELPALFLEKVFYEIYEKISRPIYRSYLEKQELEIIKAALKRTGSKQEANKIFKKFWWTRLGWETIDIHSEKYFLDRILKWQKNKNLKNKYSELKTRVQESIKLRESIIKQYKFSAEFIHWLAVMEKFFYFHDLRKEMQVKTVYAGNLILREVARRVRLDWNDLEWLNRNEVKLILAGTSLNEKEIIRRKKAVSVLVDKNGYELLSGEKAIKFANRELVFKENKTKNLKGVGASPGKVSGKVKVCNGAEEAFRKIKKGDILVCPMTLPDYVPAMKKARAIITEEGGITCHAAIISRELNIPCIVGTKIATQVLKDGDLVEVDANKGTVRILK